MSYLLTLWHKKDQKSKKKIFFKLGRYILHHWQLTFLFLGIAKLKTGLSFWCYGLMSSKLNYYDYCWTFVDTSNILFVPQLLGNVLVDMDNMVLNLLVKTNLSQIHDRVGKGLKNIYIAILINIINILEQ